MTQRVLIVNPQAKGGWPRKKWPVIEPLLREAIADLDVRFTAKAGDGKKLAQAAVEQGAKLVIAMGGDGTASEVASGLLSAFENGAHPEPTCAFGYLPCATGGDLRRVLGTSTDLGEAARAIGSAKPRLIDAGCLDYTDHDGQPRRGYFVNVASCGISGLIDHFVNEGHKTLGGPATFFLASVRASLRYKNARVLIRIDGEPAFEQRIYTLAIANGSYFGGGMHIGPQAQIDDGLFDVVALGDLSFFEALRLGTLIYAGHHDRMSKVSFRKARRVVVEPALPGEKVLLDVDGETPGRLPATFSILPKALLYVG